MVIQRERQRERAALRSVMLDVGGVGWEVVGVLDIWVWACDELGVGRGVEVPDVLGERGRESGKCVICVWAET